MKDHILHSLGRFYIYTGKTHHTDPMMSTTFRHTIQCTPSACMYMFWSQYLLCWITHKQNIIVPYSHTHIQRHIITPKRFWILFRAREHFTKGKLNVMQIRLQLHTNTERTYIQNSVNIHTHHVYSYMDQVYVISGRRLETHPINDVCLFASSSSSSSLL